MEQKHIDNCSEYFYYGDIIRSVQAESFLSNEDEEVELSDIVLKYLEGHNRKKKLYCFTTKVSNFPVNFRDKKFGLWKSVMTTEKIRIADFRENMVDLKWYRLYYGIAELPREQLYPALQLCQTDFMKSYLLLSDFSFDAFADFDSIVEILNEKFSLNYAGLINRYYEKADIITAIKGCNGDSINIFSSKQSV